MSTKTYKKRVKTFIRDCKHLLSKKSASPKFLIKTFLIGFIFGVLFFFVLSPLLVKEILDNRREQERARQAALYRASGEAILPLEEEKQVFSAFLTGLEKVERMASDWKVQDKYEVIKFLTKEARYALPADVEEVLNCKIKNPDARYPKCDAEYYTFSEFFCDHIECSWTFCRKGSAPNSCIYSGGGRLERGSYTWNHEISFGYPQVLEFAKWVGKTHNWEVHNYS
ncbi:MAG: hypothetical protein IKL48_03355 [Elusimicrobiaceae bacterium]|nr:hypothetical protein [Elusimicrobiaceae bacterium]